MEITIKNIPIRIRNVLLHPRTFWKNQKKPGTGQQALFLGYLFPLIVIISLGDFLGEFTGSQHFYIGFAILKSLRVIVLYTMLYFISVFLTNELVKPFGGQKDLLIVQRLVVYSLTPFLLVSFVSGLFPFLYVINVLGLYSFYIFWVGVHELMDFPERNKSKYILTACLANIFVFGFLSIFLSKLLMAYV